MISGVWLPAYFFRPSNVPDLYFLAWQSGNKKALDKPRLFVRFGKRINV
jgi:hypothetical protein